MKTIISTERIDVLPGTTRVVHYKVGPEEKIVHVTETMKFEVMPETKSVAITNDTRQTFSVYEGTPLGFEPIREEVIKIESEASIAFADDEQLVCPLCGKTYKPGTRGETFFRNHMEKEHGTTI